MLPESDNIIDILPLIGLYAETHFRFGGWTPSLLFKREPEVIFDMPRRIDSGKDVPLLLQLNDVKRFPVKIEKVTIAISQNGKSRIVFESKNLNEFEIKHNFSLNAPSFMINIPSRNFDNGTFSLACKAEIKNRNKKIIIFNNNLITSDKKPLFGTYAEDKLPGHDRCLYGDMHVHSQYTESHVEFCPPLKAIDSAANAFGLNFLSIIDHSYDIECSMEDYLKPDPEIRRWQAFQKEINDSNFNTEIIPGEEISVLNSRKRVVHLGGAGVKTFIRGSADGARKKISIIEHSPSIDEASSSIHKDQGLSFAAHPGANCGFLQKLLLKRGVWENCDISNKIDAFQAVNNGFRKGWYRARKLWIKRLLEGQKLPLIAGNDSHGDFNRYIALKIPFINIFDDDNRYLGYGRTAVYSDKKLSQSELIQCIKDGKTFITTGPYVQITNNEDKNLICSSPITISNLKISAESTKEFGQIDTIRIFRGYIERKREDLLILKNNINSYNYSYNFDLNDTDSSGYIRVEILCKSSGLNEQAMAATSPIYIG